MVFLNSPFYIINFQLVLYRQILRKRVKIEYNKKKKGNFMTPQEKELVALKDEIRGELRAIFKANMKILKRR